MTPALEPVSNLMGVLSLPLTVSVSPTLLALIYGLVVVFWAVMTVIYLYHWRKFPYQKRLLRRAERLYLLVSIVFAVLALGGIIAL